MFKTGKFIRIMAVVVSTVMLLAACGKGSDKNTETKVVATQSNVNYDPLGGKYEKPLTVKIAYDEAVTVRYLPGEDIDNNIWTKLYKEQYNIDVKIAFTAAQWTDYDTKMNMFIASNDLPDIFKVDGKKLAQLVQDDMIADMTEAYKYMLPLAKKFYDYNPLNLKSVAFNGKMYALPAGAVNVISASNNLIIRKDWMDKVGIKEVKTLNDFYALMEAFALKDPDGNGKKDTYGIPLNKDLNSASSNSSIFYKLANAKGVYAYQWNNYGDGKLAYGAIQPAMKDVLAKVAELYSKGCVDKEFGVKSAANVSKDTAAGKYGIILDSWAATEMKNLKKNFPDAEFENIIIPNDAGQPSLVEARGVPSQFYVVKKGFQNPEALIKMANIRCEKRNGPTAEPDKYNQDPVTGVETHLYGVRLINEYPMKNNDTSRLFVDLMAKGTTEPTGLTKEQQSKWKQVMDYKKNPSDVNLWSIYMGILDPKTVAVNNLAIEKKLQKVNEWSGNPGDAYINNWANLDKLTLDTFTKIIYNEAPVSDFDKYVENWKKMGGDAVTKEINDWYLKNK